jgi:DNA replication protein DnaC
VEAGARDLNPHLTARQGVSYPCPHGICDGSGWVLADDEDTARPCECREQRIATARSLRLKHEIPERYQHLALEREPVRGIMASMEPAERRRVTDFCQEPERFLADGRGIWFMGPRGTGKTTLAMLISQHVMAARRTVAIYTAPQLLTAIRTTYDEDSPDSYTQLIERLRAVDLLHVEDLAVARPNEWVLEQFYTVINDRYQDRRSVLFTADVAQPPDLGRHVGDRTYSRLMEMCGEQIHMFGDDQRIKQLAESRMRG